MRGILGNNPGFTLIEIMIVVAIIGVLGTAVIAAINPIQQMKKARDQAKIQALIEIQQSLRSYMIFYGRPPINRAPGSAYYSNQPNFLQELVDTQEIKKIPKSPQGAFGYYDYGRGNDMGAMLAVQLEAIDDTVVPPPGSCRPFNNANWCSSVTASKWYCLCNAY